MKVSYIDHMGDDLRVANAARVSMGRQSTEFGERDERLIHYLARHDHWTPFAHPQITFHISTPIFVARQLKRHEVGLVWNEISGRYVELGETFWHPDEWRQEPQKRKQGSSGALPDAFKPPVEQTFEKAKGLALDAYKILRQNQVAPEQARAVLPLATYTEWYWTGSLAAFARVCRLRLGEDAQEETGEIANQISSIIRPLFPVSWSAIMGEK